MVGHQLSIIEIDSRKQNSNTEKNNLNEKIRMKACVQIIVQSAMSSNSLSSEEVTGEPQAI